MASTSQHSGFFDDSDEHRVVVTNSQFPESKESGFNRKILLASIAASLSTLNFGWCVGEPNIPEAIIEQCIEGPKSFYHGFPSCLPMSDFIWGLVVGLVAIGAMVGSMFAGRVADRFGRKKVLLYNNIFYICGAILLGTSTSVVQLAVGRFISGIGCGVSSTVVATYNSECAPVKCRGMLGTMLQFSVEVGIFFSQLFSVALVKAPNWRILFGLSGAISLIQILWLPFMPESPKFLISKGKISEARCALQYFRPNHDITNEFSSIVECCHTKNSRSAAFVESDNSSTNGSETDESKPTAIERTGFPDGDKLEVRSNSSTDCDDLQHKNESNLGLFDILRGKSPDMIQHSIFCVLFLMAFQQWTGSKGIVFYSTEILTKIEHLTPEQIRHIPNIAQWITIAISASGVVAVFISMMAIDRLGRRILLLLSTGGIAISCILIVVGRVAGISVISVLFMFIFKLAYGVGFAPIPWLTASEMVPYYALGALSGFASAINWTMIFIIGLVFPRMAKALGDYLFLPFVATNCIAFLVVLLFVPETKGRSLDEMLSLHGKKIHVIFSLRKPKENDENKSDSQNCNV